MLEQIIVRTPLWVWALLAFLIFLGVSASTDREVPLRRIFIIPLVMLALSVQGIAATFGASPLGILVWLACAVAAGLITWHFPGKDSVTSYPERGTVLQRGSWVPLALMMGIFVTKYAVAVALAIHPGFKQAPMFAAAVCALYGVFNGIFIGNMLRALSAYLSARASFDNQQVNSFSRSSSKNF